MTMEGGGKVLQTSNKDRKIEILSKPRDGRVHGRIKGLGRGTKDRPSLKQRGRTRDGVSTHHNHF